MKKIMIALMFFLSGCNEGKGSAESNDSDVVNKQQLHYAKVHPVPFFEYSYPRFLLIEIYKNIVNGNVMTYSVIESQTGVTKFRCPSKGYPIPVDTQLTNGLQAVFKYRQDVSGVTIEQAEPNGLFTSKNTDSTWVPCVDDDGAVTPVYTEHKVTAFPFPVIKDVNGEFVRQDSKSSMSIKQ
jgi:hypothetical protein